VPTKVRKRTMKTYAWDCGRQTNTLLYFTYGRGSARTFDEALTRISDCLGLHREDIVAYEHHDDSPIHSFYTQKDVAYQGDKIQAKMIFMVISERTRGGF
jgi:hypothetical protein